MLSSRIDQRCDPCWRSEICYFNGKVQLVYVGMSDEWKSKSDSGAFYSLINLTQDTLCPR